MSFIVEFFKNQDMFGSAVTLRYGSWTRKESSGDEKHKSLFGGIISMLSNTFIYGIFIYFFIRMVTYDNNRFTSYTI
jgi:hypothetical protein